MKSKTESQLEDQEDIRAFEERAGESVMTYPELLKKLQALKKITAEEAQQRLRGS